MRRNRKRLVISLAVLTLIGAGLLFWVLDGTKVKNTAIQSQTEGQVPQEEILKKKKDKDKIEQSQDKVIEKETQENVTLVFSGDVLLSNYVLDNYETSGISGIVSEEMVDEMRNADITMINEEFPFSVRGNQAQDKQFTFRVDPVYVKIFQELGIDVVTVANNHALDYGKEALSDTFQTLDDADIAYVGAGETNERAAEPYKVEAGGKTFGILAASRVIPEVSWNVENQQPGMLCTYDSRILCDAINKAKETCDYVVVYVHWGIERDNVPQDYQRQLGKEYIDAGADMVIGSHPHVLQGIEYYNEKPIVYSLGNYIFNQEIGSTLLLKATVSPQNKTELQLIPAYAAGAKTQKMAEVDSAKLYQFMEDISYGILVEDDGRVSP